MSEITIRAKSVLKVTDGVNNVDFMADKGVLFSDFVKRLPGVTGLDKQVKQLQSKIAAISIAVADNDIDEVKRLLPLSGEQVVREIEQAAIESATFYYREPKDNPSLSLSQLHPGKLSFVLENTKTEEWLSVSVEVTRTPDDEKPIQTWEDIENLNNDDVSCVRFSEDEKNGVWLDHEPLRESAYTLNLNQDALKIANDIRVKAAKRLHDLRNPEQEKV